MARSGFQQGKLNTICLAPLKVCKPDPRLLKEFVVVKGLYSSRELDNGICGAVGIIGDRIGAARYRRRVGNNIRVVGCAASYACHCFHFPCCLINFLAHLQLVGISLFDFPFLVMDPRETRLCMSECEF